MDLGTLEGRIAITHGTASARFGHPGSENICRMAGPSAPAPLRWKKMPRY